MSQHQIGVDEVGSVTVYDEDDRAVQLSTLWQSGTAVLVFVRHFGWIICRQQVAELAGHEEDFSKKGARLAVIGNGRVKDLKKFRAVTGYRGTLLTDPSLRSYQLLEFKNGLASLIGVKSFSQSFLALKAGVLPGSLQGNALQLGGAVVIEPAGSINYFFQSSVAGDHPPVEALLRAAG